MIASFDNEEAYKHALHTWATDKGLVLIAYATGCGGYASGERCYFNVTQVEYNHAERVIIATGDSRHPDQITNSGETEWGWWTGQETNSHGSSATKSGDTVTGDSSNASSKPLGQLECTAPADNAHGLPTACLGRNFDQLLDQKLGYTELSAASKQFLERAKAIAIPAGGRNSTLLRGRGRGRAHVRRGFFDTIYSFFSSAYKQIYNAVVSAISIDKDVDYDFSFQLPDPNSPATSLPGGLVTAQSPWGNAILLKSLGSPTADSQGVVKYMNVYCVDCGASGHAKVAGKAKWSPVTGLEQGQVQLQTDLRFVLKLGIEADVSLRYDFTTDLFNYGLPALSYGVVTIGPYVSVGARVGVEAAAQGQVLVGAEMGIQDASVVLDIVDASKNAKSGWEPSFKPIFEASGQVALSAELGLPVGIKLGLKISTWEQAVGIVDEPSIKGTAKVAGAMLLSDSGNFTAGISELEGCTGILTELSWRNKLWVGLVGPSNTPVLDTKDRPVLHKCIG
jgi:hypothetical protein